MIGDAVHLRRFGRLVAAGARIRLIRAGIHLGLFEALRTARGAAELARELSLAPDLVEAWLVAAHASGLVRRGRGGDAWSASAFSLWLLDSPHSRPLCALLDQAVETTGPVLERLPGLMRGASRPEFGAPAEARRAAEVSRMLEGRALSALARIPGTRDARRVLDVGCGTGGYLAAWLQRHRDARGLGIELDADLADEARRQLEAAGVGRRAEVVVGDFTAMELRPGTFDLALLNNNLYYFAPADRPPLFERVRACLDAGGVAAIQYPARVEHPLARAFGLGETSATFDLFLRAHANLYGLPDTAEVHEQLRAAGFGDVGDVAILPGGAAVFVWGRTPS